VDDFAGGHFGCAGPDRPEQHAPGPPVRQRGGDGEPVQRHAVAFGDRGRARVGALSGRQPPVREHLLEDHPGAGRRGVGEGGPGGRVERVEPAHGEVAEISHDRAGLFAGIPSPCSAVRYHSLAATLVPDDLLVTATCPGPGGAEGEVVMGVRHRSLPLQGVQFHPESVLSEHGIRLVANFLGMAR